MQGTEKIVNADFFLNLIHRTLCHLRTGLRVLTKKIYEKRKLIFFMIIFYMTYCTDWLIFISNNHFISLPIIDSIYFLIYLVSFAIYAELTSHMALCKIHKECWNFVFLTCPLCLGSKVVTEVLWRISSAGLLDTS